MDTEIKARSTLRRINSKCVIKAVKKLFIEANTVLGEDVVGALAMRSSEKNRKPANRY